jgi:hypothetical protein
MTGFRRDAVRARPGGGAGRRAAGRVLPLVLLAAAAETVPGQARPREIECFSLLFSSCRNYEIEVVRVLADGTSRPQGARDTLEDANPDTLDPRSYLVLELFEEDRLAGRRAVIWVRRTTGEVGGDWPAVLANDFVRSASLRGVPGDVAELHDQRDFRRGGAVVRLVIFAGDDDCSTNVNLDRGGPCTVAEGGRVSGKVSGIRISYRAPPQPATGAPAPGAPPAEPAAPRPAPAAPAAPGEHPGLEPPPPMPEDTAPAPPGADPAAAPDPSPRAAPLGDSLAPPVPPGRPGAARPRLVPASPAAPAAPPAPIRRSAAASSTSGAAAGGLDAAASPL